MDYAVALHRGTGLGLLDTVYEAVLARDLEARGPRAARQVPVPITSRAPFFPGLCVRFPNHRVIRRFGSHPFA
ncbi:MAG TPA: GxxExxY protein [Candidatus Hydrogenedentes bacterium]|nr:GxxExxY protein [Candidatus Hydrogenedentota bacterium]HQH69052.1 GxxExxY protein [Candidatus Hydrogenedentota bacterium]HQM51332.1 GxxExxY protein [Candidatus Hydrogenedentota bacterium]